MNGTVLYRDYTRHWKHTLDGDDVENLIKPNHKLLLHALSAIIIMSKKYDYSTNGPGIK